MNFEKPGFAFTLNILINPIWIVPVRQGTVLGKSACSLLSSDPEEPQKFVNS